MCAANGPVPLLQGSGDWTLPPSVELCSFHLDALERASAIPEGVTAGGAAPLAVRSEALGGRVRPACLCVCAPSRVLMRV
jgi:hypothetical protein